MKLRFLPHLLLILICNACVASSPSPAVAPAPLAEVPSLRFPEEVGGQFDVTTVAGAGGGSSMKFFVSEGDDISGIIADAASNTVFFLSLIDEILGPLHELEIPSREDVTSFEDVITIGDQLVRVQIDFKPYKNKLGVTCSGNTGSPPICYRIWFNGKRGLSGVFLKTIPTETNPGDGFIQGLSPVKILGAFPFATAGTYDLRDPTQKSVDFFIGAMTRKDPVLEDIPEHETDFDAAIHLTLNQEGPAESALKTLNASTRNHFEGEVEHEERHVARWREGEDFWSGTEDRGPLDDYSEFGEFFAACANISTGLVINPSFDPESLCVKAGLDVSEIPFLEFLKIGDLAFPSDFPLAPPSPPFLP